MKPSHVAAALTTLLTLKQPVFLWGAPGVGKSQVVAQAAQKLGFRLIDLRAVLLDPVDLRGLPHLDNKNGRARWSPPAFLPADGQGILFLDELNAAPPLVQAACYQLILDRKLGEYQLPDGWCVAAAGNRESDRAVTHRMPSALANRFVHLDFEPDLGDWLAWAESADILPEIMAFLRFRPGLLLEFDPRKAEKAFSSPRSWEFASRILSAGPAPELRFDLLKGTIGEGATAELLGFLEVFHHLPAIPQVLAAPDAVEIPDDPAVLHALAGAVAREAAPETIAAITRLAGRLPTEFGVLLMREVLRTAPELSETSAFAAWAEDNADVLF